MPYTCINSGYSGGYATVSTMHAIEIDIWWMLVLGLKWRRLSKWRLSKWSLYK
jgi:hypothetical protein